LDPQSVYWWAPWLAPLASIVGLSAAFLIPHTPAANPQTPVVAGFHPRKFFANWAILKSRSGLLPAVFGTVLFWSIGVLVTLNAANVAKTYLGLGSSPIDANSLIIAVTIGLGVGSLVAGRLSRGAIELGLAPTGAVLWVISFLGLLLAGWFGRIPGADGGLVERFWPTALFLVLNGFAAGMYVVPLNAYIEHHSPPADRASCIATASILQVLGMIAASALSGVACAVSEQSGPRMLWLIGGLTLAVASYFIIRRLPDAFVKMLMWLLVRILYRVRVRGQEAIPAAGPALIVFNHTSFADGVIALTSIKRPVRFIVYKSFCENPKLRWLANLMKAIPIDSEGAPKEIIGALRVATDALNNGEVVAIFAEGGISRTGVMMPFQRGMATILKRAKNAPIVPGYIDGMWGSVFSFQGGKFFWKRPRGWPWPVTLMFAKPLPSDASVFQVRQAVQLLGAECWKLRKKRQTPLAVNFVRTAWKYGRRPCIADSMRNLAYGETLKAGVALANVLKRKLGADEAMVGVFAPPSVGGALANMALAFLGRTSVNLNYTIGAEVIDRCIAQCNIKHVVTSKAFVEKLKIEPGAKLLFLEDLRAEVGTGDKLAAAAAWLLPPSLALATVLRPARMAMDGLATIVFSSGSTGDPKGVMLTQQNIVSNVEAVVNVIDADHRDAIMGVLPFFHSFGYTVALWLPLSIGAQAIYHFSPLESDVIGKMIREYRASIFLSTATFLRGHLRKNDKEELQSLRLIVCGAEKLPMQLADQFEKKFGVRPLEGYGCTELSPVVSVNRPDVIDGSYKQVCNKLGSIGHPIPGVAVRVVDPESFVELPVGAEGLLEVYGPNVMQGYLHKPEQTAQAMHDGWYQTGDIAKLDEDGFITITDRMSRFSKIGGEMVPHAKVEDAIHDILETTDRACIVVGIPDERKGERLLVVHAKLSQPVDKIWERLKERLPPLWLPAKSAFREVEEIPILGSGKPDLKRAKTLALQANPAEA
jgi:acyl-[acyl-carrier-protein]-phospholipid O-acyltransferase/long-chain-fatty-acid--[acyl-carrier-protein] ligase